MFLNEAAEVVNKLSLGGFCRLCSLQCIKTNLESYTEEPFVMVLTFRVIVYLSEWRTYEMDSDFKIYPKTHKHVFKQYLIQTINAAWLEALKKEVTFGS